MTPTDLDARRQLADAQELLTKHGFGANSPDLEDAIRQTLQAAIMNGDNCKVLEAILAASHAREAALVKERDEALAERWACFHCGFETQDRADAAAHFGDRDEEEPLCRTWADLNTNDRLREYQSVLGELNAEREETGLQRTRIEGLEYQVESQRSEIHSFAPFRKCDSIHDVFHVYDSMEGRALLAEEQSAALVDYSERLRGALGTQDELKRLTADLQECLATAFLAGESLTDGEILGACQFLRSAIFSAKVTLEEATEALAAPPPEAVAEWRRKRELREAGYAFAEAYYQYQDHSQWRAQDEAFKAFCALRAQRAPGPGSEGR